MLIQQEVKKVLLFFKNFLIFFKSLNLTVKFEGRVANFDLLY